MLLLTLLAGFGAWLSSFASSLSFWTLAIVGIGLVVFVHEAGHFLVAKHYGVRVEIFSLGFGPRLFGWKRGDTDYRVSLVPIGGYVKMAGDNPGDALQGDGGDLPSKSVGQRFAIFSAGVVMNLIFAVVVLPIVLAVGVQFHSTRIGGVTPGGPAWLAGIAKGDEVVAIGGHPIVEFNDLVAEVALSGADGVELELVRAGTPPAEGEAPRPTEKISLQPEYDEAQGRYVIGVSPSAAPSFEVEKDGPAERAGFRAGDQIVRFEGRPVSSLEDFDVKRARNRRDRVTLGVIGADGIERELTVEPHRAEEPVWLVGIEPWLNRVRAVRGRAIRPDFVEPGDELLAVKRADSGAETPAILAPVRDAEELADAFELARQEKGARLLLRRDSELVLVPLPADVDRGLAQDIALSNQPTSRHVRLLNGYPAALAGLPDGAEIVRVNHYAVLSWTEIKERIEKESPKPGSDATAKPIELVAELDGIQHTVVVTPRLERLPVDFGLLLDVERVTRSYPLFEAVRIGVSSAGYMIKNVYLTLKKMLSREVAASNLSGILTIAYVSRSLAEAGWPTLFYFLAVLSLNLAFLNLLPIPVLDGGHLFFLIVEKVKGSPVSEKVMGFSQLVGLVLVLALLLFVTYTDIKRFFP